jgi:glutathione peroxidase
MRAPFTAVLLLAACSTKPAPAPVAPTPAPAETQAAPPPTPTEAAPAVVYGENAKAQDPMQLPAPGTAPTPVPVGTDFAAVWETPLHTLKGAPTTLAAHKGKALLIVNVASKCGLTPQYSALEALEEKYGKQGFDVIGFPCNQFGKQEPGSAEEIQSFCSATYGVTFPMMEKVEVNGDGRHPIYKVLTKIPDAKGEAGDIQWNFEKFVVSADGKTVTRFRPKTTPDDPSVIAAIENALPKKK